MCDRAWGRGKEETPPLPRVHDVYEERRKPDQCQHDGESVGGQFTGERLSDVYIVDVGKTYSITRPGTRQTMVAGTVDGAPTK